MPHGEGFESKAVFNPGVIKKDGIVYMLYRAIGDFSTYISYLGLATSTDNIHFERASSLPVFSPHTTYAKGAVEDPRIVFIDGTFYITYVAVPQLVFENGVPPLHPQIPLITSAALLTTTDFVTFKDCGVITPENADDKDVVLFPEKINGKYAMLHRPFFWSKKGIESPEAKAYAVTLPCDKELLPAKPTVWLSYSEDLYHWDNHIVLQGLLEEGDDKIGPGLPPLKTSRGWVVIYHHVEMTKLGNIYSAKAALLDLHDPSKVLSRLPYDILHPETKAEKEGFVKNVVFPSGGFIENDTLYVYYGAGDSSISLATGNVNELLAEFDNHIL